MTDQTSAPSSSPIAYPRASVLYAIEVGGIISLINLIVSVGIISLDVKAYVENRGTHSWARPSTRAARWLLLLSFFGMFAFVITSLMFWVDWRGNEAGCDAITAPLLPLVYVSMKQCSYLFLYDRAKVVHAALRLNGEKMKALRWTVWLGSTIGIPSLTWWNFFVFWRAKVLPEAVCVEYFLSTISLVMLVAVDVLFSVALLVMFIVPLIRHVRRPNTTVSKKVFQSVLRSNIVISVIMIVSTITALITMSVELTVNFGKHPNPATEYRQVWVIIAPLTDAIITVVFPHLMTNIWVPWCLRNSFKKSRPKPTVPWRGDVITPDNGESGAQRCNSRLYEQHRSGVATGCSQEQYSDKDDRSSTQMIRS
jgi:hypothetical protein